MKLIETAIAKSIVERQIIEQRLKRFLANLSPIRASSTVGEVFGGDD